MAVGEEAGPGGEAMEQWRGGRGGGEEGGPVPVRFNKNPTIQQSRRRWEPPSSISQPPTERRADPLTDGIITFHYNPLHLSSTPI